MKHLFNSFLLTFIVTIITGVMILFFVNVDNNIIDVRADEFSPAEKRAANKDDILDIFQLIKLRDKKLITGISINPMTKDIIVENYPVNLKSSYNHKSLGDLYEYGGIKLLVKTINKDYNKKYNRYLLIKNENDLIKLLDVVGSLEIEGKLYDNIKNNTKINSQIIDSENFLELLNNRDEKITMGIIKEAFKQKISILDTQMGEETFKKMINIVDSDISYKDFNNLTQVRLDEWY